MPRFSFGGQRLAYTVYGEGPRPVVLLPGLLLSQKMQKPLARQLALRGNRVVTLDPLGHGASDRPLEMWHYSMSAFARQTVALLDHLELDRAVVGGTSLGANITLEVASDALRKQTLRRVLTSLPRREREVLLTGRRVHRDDRVLDEQLRADRKSVV